MLGVTSPHVSKMPKSLRDKILNGNIPNHIAIIMDGNGRWARERSSLA